ncbi:MAG TPA: M56 family metallopeptidase [Thermoanaerobaculia bacterium]
MSSAVASVLFAAAWKGTLLVAFALAVHRVARNRVPSRWLCALLLVAIVRLLVPVAPAASFSVFNLIPAETVQPAPVFVGEPDAERGFRPPAAGVGRTEAPPYVRQPWIPVVLALWGAGALFVIARAVLQTRRFQRQLADSVDVARDDVLALVGECRETLNVRRRVRVVTTSAVATPSLHGWLHPTLLLPAELLSTFTLGQLRYVVLHELAHLRRSDVLINWIATAAHALHWFNPLVRLAVARFAEERELACDALALAALRAEERPAYGGTVLELVDRMRVAPAVPALVGMTATPAQLKRRIVMIASFRQNRFSIVFPALVVAVGLATLTDARAGEPALRRHVSVFKEASPAIKETMQKLEVPMTADLSAASVDDVLNAVMNATGASVVVADGALDDATRAKRLNVKAKNVPAHLVLFESVGTLHLGVKFTDKGVLVFRAEEGEGEIHMRKAEHEATRVRVHKAEGAASPDDTIIRIIESSERTDGKRRLTLHGIPGQEGELEIELVDQK